MNRSGESVGKLLHYYKLIAAEYLLIIHDDKDLLLGKLREKVESGSGGHKGVSSIMNALGSEVFHRLKFGVGHEDQKIPTDAFVLQKFSEEEEAKLPGLITTAVKKVQDWLRKIPPMT